MEYIYNNINCFYIIMIMDMDMLDCCLVIVVADINANEYIVIIIDVYY